MAQRPMGHVQELCSSHHRQRDGRNKTDPGYLHRTLLHDRRRDLRPEGLRRLHAAHHHGWQLQIARRLEGRGDVVQG